MNGYDNSNNGRNNNSDEGNDSNSIIDRIASVHRELLLIIIMGPNPKRAPYFDFFRILRPQTQNCLLACWG